MASMIAPCASESKSTEILCKALGHLPSLFADGMMGVLSEMLMLPVYFSSCRLHAPPGIDHGSEATFDPRRELGEG